MWQPGIVSRCHDKSGRVDLNHRPPGPEPGALTGLRYAPNAPRRTRTPSLLIRSHVYGDSNRHAATRAVIPRRTRPTVYRNRRPASRPARGTPTFTPTLPR